MNEQCCEGFEGRKNYALTLVIVLSIVVLGPLLFWQESPNRQKEV